MRLILTITIGVLISSCGRTNKEKLSHKWVVKGAISILCHNMPPNPSQETIEMANAMSAELDSIYRGEIYDLKKDGSCEIVRNNNIIKGKWVVKNSKVYFNLSNGETDTWEFKRNRVEIFGDTSIRVFNNHDAALTLKPALGENVEPDKF